MLSKRLKEIRISLDLTQQEMANKLNISRVRYNQYETGRRQPDNDMLKILATNLNVSIDFLLGHSDNEQLTPDQQLAILLSDPSLAVAFQDYDSWTDEDKIELVNYLKAKRIARENKDKL